MRTLSIDEIARVCHEANRAYCHTINDREGIPWDEETDAQRNSVIAGVEAVIDDPHLTPERSHQKWMAYKKAEGWTYGSVKDEEKKTHPNLALWDELSIQQKRKDHLFQAIVRELLR